MNLNSQNQFYFLFFTLLGHIASVNNVVVTVLHLLQALHRRIIVCRILSEIQKLMTHTSELLPIETLSNYQPKVANNFVAMQNS